MTSNDLTAYFHDAAAEIQERGEPEKAILFGCHIRINIPKALKAIFHAVMAVHGGRKLTDDSVEALGVGHHIVSAISAAMDATFRSLSAFHYVVAIALKRSDDAMTIEQIEDAVRELLTGAGELPWYFGLTRRRLSKARTEFEDSSVEAALSHLSKAGLVARVDGAFVMTDYNYTLRSDG